MIDGERRPLGWLSDADLRAETVPQRPDTSPEPVLERDDVMRDALSDLLQAETRYAPVVDGEGRIAGVLSVEIISEFLTSPEALARGASGGGEGAWVISPLAVEVGGALTLAQSELGEDFFRDRSNPDCVQRQRSLLLRVGRRQPRRSLPHSDARAPGAGLGLGRARVRDRARPGARLPPPPLAGARDHGRHRGSLHGARASPSSCSCSRSPAAAPTPRSSRSPPTRSRSSIATPSPASPTSPPRPGTPAGAWA